MAWTPSNLYVASAGSAKLSVAYLTANVHSQTDLWTSYIPDIFAVVGSNDTGGVQSANGLAVSYTPTNGVIWVQRDVSMSGT